MPVAAQHYLQSDRKRHSLMSASNLHGVHELALTETPAESGSTNVDTVESSSGQIWLQMLHRQVLDEVLRGR